MWTTEGNGKAIPGLSAGETLLWNRAAARMAGELRYVCSLRHWHSVTVGDEEMRYEHSNYSACSHVYLTCSRVSLLSCTSSSNTPQWGHWGQGVTSVERQVYFTCTEEEVYTRKQGRLAQYIKSKSLVYCTLPEKELGEYGIPHILPWIGGWYHHNDITTLKMKDIKGTCQCFDMFCPFPILLDIYLTVIPKHTILFWIVSCFFFSSVWIKFVKHFFSSWTIFGQRWTLCVFLSLTERKGVTEKLGEEIFYLVISQSMLTFFKAGRSHIHIIPFMMPMFAYQNWSPRCQNIESACECTKRY